VYCPLCKSEYRAGYERCSDCQTSLVHTREQAGATKVCLFWEGTGQTKFNGIVAILRDANVPTYARSRARAGGKRSFLSHVPIIGVFVRAAEAGQQLTWQVFVLEQDFPIADTLVRSGGGTL
jgi:hypothetical protein